MSNEYNDWVLDREQGVAIIFYKLRQSILEITEPNDKLTELSNIISEVFKKYDHVLEIFKKREWFNQNLLPDLHTLELIIARDIYPKIEPICLELKEANNQSKLGSCGENILQWYDIEELKEIIEQEIEKFE